MFTQPITRFSFFLFLIFFGFSNLAFATILDFADPGASLSLADYQFIAEDAFDHTGLVANAGDVDGDGLNDILIGAVYNYDDGRYAGKAYLILGASLGSSSSIDLSLADYQFIGEDDADIAGFSVSSAGDVDGDGLSDILIGNYLAEKVYLVLASSLGSSSTVNLSSADYRFSGTGIGTVVASAGDVDGDGRLNWCPF